MAVSAMAEALPDRPLNPDCTQEKHRACSGQAWDWDTDDLVACACPCHTDGGA